MADFNPSPYRGEASIPHVSEDFFKVYFMGAQVHHLRCYVKCLKYAISVFTLCAEGLGAIVFHEPATSRLDDIVWPTSMFTKLMFTLSVQRTFLGRPQESCLSDDVSNACALQLALGFLLLPGRILGSEIRPRKYK